MSRRFGTLPFISEMFVNVPLNINVSLNSNEHSTDEGQSPETSGHLLLFWHFQQHSQLLFFLLTDVRDFRPSCRRVRVVTSYMIPYNVPIYRYILLSLLLEVLVSLTTLGYFRYLNYLRNLGCLKFLGYFRYFRYIIGYHILSNYQS